MTQSDIQSFAIGFAVPFQQELAQERVATCYGLPIEGVKDVAENALEIVK